MDTPITSIEAPPSTSSETHTCPTCGKTFATQNKLGGHLSAAHGPRNEPVPGGVPCEVCGKRFDTIRKVASHKISAHGARRKPEAKPIQIPAKPPAPRTETDDMLDGFAGELQAQLDKLDVKLAGLTVEVAAVRASRQRVAAVLRTLAPADNKPAARTSRGANTPGFQDFLAESRLRKFAMLRDFLEAHAAELRDGFTSNSLAAMIRDADIEPKISPKSIRDLLDNDLRNGGLVRADRIIRGGGMRYKLLSSPNGAGGNHDGEA